MTWIRENKFLTAFFAILVIGAGVLGYLLYTASGSFDEVSENYTRQAAELKRLQNLTPFPDQANLQKLSEQKQAYMQSLSNLQKTLSGMEFPVEPMTPEKFQDKLRAAVSQMMDKAKSADIKLPEKFYLGFENYQTSLPKPEAAALLGRQLQAIQRVVDLAFEAKIDEITSLSRSALPEESGAPVKAEARGGKANTPADAKSLVAKSSFDLNFRAEQTRFRKWLNDLSSNKDQFYIVRLLAVSNDNPKPPSRLEAGAADASAAPADPVAAASSPAGNSLKFVVGIEKVNVTAKIDVLDFNPATAAK